MILGGCGGEATVKPAQTLAPVAQAASQPAVDYVSEKGKFATRYPASWRPRIGGETLDLVPVTDDSGGHRTVSIDVPSIPPHLPGMITLERIENGYVNDLVKHFADVKVVSSTDFPMNDARATLLQATAVDAKMYTVLAMRHERVYIIASETDVAGADAGKKAVNMILASWQWDNH